VFFLVRRGYRWNFTPKKRDYGSYLLEYLIDDSTKVSSMK
jgi:hypothetical protein